VGNDYSCSNRLAVPMRRAVQERHAALVLQKRERRRRQRFHARQEVVGV
jgi:hypothetical protein